MGWLNSLITGLFGVGQQASQNSYNTKEAEKNREWQSAEADTNRIFQADQAALQRDWSAAEAERARDWNEEMYAKYNSLSGKIAQAEQAGVNPLFAVTGNAVSPMQTTASAPSGSSATGSGVGSVGNATSSFVDIIGSILGLKRFESESKVNDALAEKYNNEAEKIGKESAWIDKLNQSELENHLMNRELISSQINVNDETAGKLSAEALKLQQEGIRISKITDFEVKKAEADALISEFQSSVYRIASDFENADTADFVQMGVYLLEKIIGIGVSLSPRGIVHMN